MENKCSICLDRLFLVNTDVSVPPCGHLFHKHCIGNSMKNNLQCSKCKAVIERGITTKIHPDVFDELVYSDCSIETNNFLGEIYDQEKEKRIYMLDRVRKLDKENVSLKETYKNNKENRDACKLF